MARKAYNVIGSWPLSPQGSRRSRPLHLNTYLES